jgi:hypothetical protein
MVAPDALQNYDDAWHDNIKENFGSMGAGGSSEDGDVEENNV